MPADPTENKTETLAKLIELAKVAGTAGQDWTHWTGSDEAQDLIRACEPHLRRRDIDLIRNAHAEGIQAHRIAGGWKSIWTTAPDDYDAFGTFTVEGPLPEAWYGKTLRRVLIDPHYVNYQCDRFGSGNHGSWEEDPREEEKRHREAQARRDAEAAEQKAKHAEGLEWLRSLSEAELEQVDQYDGPSDAPVVYPYERFPLDWKDVRSERTRRQTEAAELTRAEKLARCRALFPPDSPEGFILVDDGMDPGYVMVARFFPTKHPGREPAIYYGVRFYGVTDSTDPDKAEATLKSQYRMQSRSMASLAEDITEGRLRVAKPDEVPPVGVVARFGETRWKRIKAYVLKTGRRVWVDDPSFRGPTVLDENGHLVRKKAEVEEAVQRFRSERGY